MGKTSLLGRNKAGEIIEEVSEVGPKNRPKNFWVEELSSAQNVRRYFPMQKKFSYVRKSFITETRQFYGIILLVYLHDLNAFLYVPGI